MASSSLNVARFPAACVNGLWAALAGIVLVLGLPFMAGCDDQAKDDAHEVVTIAGKAYTLELSATPEKRIKGLSDRTSIPEGTGMLFAFPEKQAQVLEFVMRDCPIPIDIIFLDRSGRVTATHAMKVEDPRKATEPKPADPRAEDPYEARLKRYSSRYVAQFAIELAGGELEKITVKEGDKIPLDLEGLKKRAK